MKDYLDNYLSGLFRQSVLKNMGVEMPRDRRLNCSTREITIEKSKDNYVVYFALPFDPDLWNALGVDNRAIPYDGIYCKPDKNAKCRDIIEITYKDISEMLQSIPVSEQIAMSRWMSDEARLEFERKIKEAKALAVAKIKDLPLIKLTRDETKANFLHLLYCLDYMAKDNKRCWDAYNKDWTDFPGQPDHISDNRAFYALDDGTYFVVSKNLYDTFFASQGNGFESCFSLTSQHRYIRGVPYWMSHAGYYMCYITDGDVTKWSAIPGHKLKLPKMICRAWGYKLVDGGFGIGKTYDKTGDRSLMWKNESLKRIFSRYSPMDSRPVDAERFAYQKYSVFYDNLDSSFNFCSDGMCGKGSNGNIPPIYETLKQVKLNPDIQFINKAILSNGKFIPKVMLPKSGLPNTKLNRYIEDILTEESSVLISYIYKYLNGSMTNEEQVRGEGVGPEVRITVFFSANGTISVKKDCGDETVIASV